MSEEVKIKISQPMFEVGELERFDNNIHNIIEKYSKLMFKEKDQILTQRIIMKQEEEIERLNNIINELERYINELERYINEEYIYDELGMKIFDASELQDKLQELKGSDKE